VRKSEVCINKDIMKNSNAHVFRLLLFITFTISTIGFSKATSIELSSPPILVSINGQKLNIEKDSLSISASGILRISPETFSTAQIETQFQVVIRHRNVVSHFPLLVYEQRFEDGKKFTEIEIRKVLDKAKPGDEILIIPVRPSASDNTPLVIHLKVTGDGC
jgi:hypothetical protein